MKKLQSLLLQSLFAVLATAFAGSALLNFYRYASSPTDENWFRDLPSRVQVIQPVPARQVKPAAPDARGPAVQTGDIVLNVDGYSIQRLDDFAAALSRTDTGSSAVRLQVIRPAENRHYTYALPAGDLRNLAVRELPPFTYVFDVFEGGASDRAGMRVGDLIVRINGQSFQTAREADVILQRAQLDRKIEYQVIRGVDSRILHVELARFGFRLTVLVSLLTGLFFIGTGAYIGIRRPLEAGARYLGMAMILVGLPLATIYRRDIREDWFAHMRDLLLPLALFLGILVWLFSAYYFPRPRTRGMPRVLLWVYGFFALAIAAGVLMYSSGGQIVVNLAILLAIVYHVALRIIYRKSVGPEYRKLHRVIFWTSMVALLVAFLLQAILAQSMGLVNIGYIGVPLAAIPAVYLFTIGRYNLMGLDLRIRKNLQYTLLSVAWEVGLLGLMFAGFLMLANTDLQLPNIRFDGTAIEVLDEELQGGQGIPLERFVIIFAGASLAYGLYRLARLGQRRIDRKYYRSKDHYQRSVDRIADSLAKQFLPNELARCLLDGNGHQPASA